METLNPAFYNNNVPICFSANDKYVPLLSATIASIIENSDSNKNYDIIILMTSINDENQVLLRKMIRDHSNFSIRFVNVGPLIYGYQFFIESDPTNTKYSNEIYYRVLVPALLPTYDYVIFLDSDVIVNTDVAGLLNYDYSKVMIGAVRDYEGIANCYNNNYERTKYRINEIGIKNFADYFISGVIVMNIKKFSEQYDVKQLLDLATMKNWQQFDQDLLNFICKDSVKIIDAEWDFVEDINKVYQSMPKNLFEEYLKSEKNPKIIHYSANRKPWVRTESKYNKYFWKYAEKTPFIEELKKNLSKD